MPDEHMPADSHPPQQSIFDQLAAPANQGDALGDRSVTRHAASDRSLIASQPTAPLHAPGPAGTTAHGTYLPHRRALRPWLGYALLIAVVISCCAASGAGTVNAILRVQDAQAAARDARTQVAALRDALKGGTYTQAATLTTVQTHLHALDSDLQRVQADLPAASLLTRVPSTASLIHMLRMGEDLVHAGESGVDAGLLLIPRLKGVLSTAGQPPSSASVAPQTPTSQPLTAADMTRVTVDVANATALVQQALAERRQVHDDDLRRFGLASLVPQLHELDALAPKIPVYLGYAQTIMRALPGLLGISHPANYLLFEVDSDELRPTGGFLGNYAVLTVAGGRLTNGLHLHDIYTLDCPRGRALCPPAPVPASFSWFHTADGYFALRDSNLDPDYPSSARLAEQLFQREGGPAVDGVISTTPAFVESILRITGPIGVPTYGVTVTDANLRDLIHYYHIQAGLGNTAGVSGATYQTSDRKAFDAAFGDAMLHAVGTLSPAQQNTLVRLVGQALATKDVQIYLNDPSVEALLAPHGVNAAVQTPQRDSVLVVDTNTGANYANADVTAQLTDAVTLDGAGTATHRLTITYTYPVVSHLYSESYVAAGGYWYYADFVRVIVPAHAHLVSAQGCSASPVSQEAHTAWGCALTLWRGTSLTLHFQWSVPGVATTSRQFTRYSLLIQRQAGAHDALAVEITPPPGSHLVQPLTPPLKVAGSVHATYAAPFTTDQTLTMSYRP